MANECERPKQADPPPTKGTSKGDKGKSDKGKSKGKPGDAGKGKPQLKPVGEASETNGTEGRQLTKQDSEPKEPDTEPQKGLSEFEKLVIIKGVERKTEDQNTTEYRRRRRINHRYPEEVSYKGQDVQDQKG